MNNTHTMNSPSFTDTLANLGAQPLGRAHLVSLHAIAHCACGDDIREHARRRFHTLTAAEQRKHAAHVLTHPDLDAVDHLMFILSSKHVQSRKNVLNSGHFPHNQTHTT